ncbi:MAG: DNA topoisomerase IV [Flavobacterium sp.]|nr:MAG: DNA topoisomerase IV [Flavobacterium sp.]
MKKVLLTILCGFLLMSCYEGERNCSDFKNGKFRFEHDVNGVKKVTIFERRDSLEIETYEGKTDTAIVRWVNDCEYVLRKKNPKNMAERKAIAMKILTTSKNSYTFEFGVVGSNTKQQGTATKLN